MIYRMDLRMYVAIHKTDIKILIPVLKIST